MHIFSQYIHKDFPDFSVNWSMQTVGYTKQLDACVTLIMSDDMGPRAGHMWSSRVRQITGAPVTACHVGHVVLLSFETCRASVINLDLITACPSDAAVKFVII